MPLHHWPMPTTRFNFHIPAYQAPIEEIQPAVVRFMLGQFDANMGDGGTQHNSRVVAVCLAQKKFNVAKSAALEALDIALMARHRAASHRIIHNVVSRLKQGVLAS